LNQDCAGCAAATSAGRAKAETAEKIEIKSGAIFMMRLPIANGYPVPPAWRLQWRPIGYG
jgi:hypothetical protein